MTDRCNLRKEAYKYVLEKLSNLPASAGNRNWIQCVPLEELRLLKEGIADPSAALVALLQDLVGDSISDVEIQAHLVAPFEKIAGK
jgi:hypothetical protein